MGQEVRADDRLINVGDCEVPGEAAVEPQVHLQAHRTIGFDRRSVGGAEGQRLFDVVGSARQDGDASSGIDEVHPICIR